MSQATPLLSLVVTTVGRPAALARMLDSVADSPMAKSIELVVVDQSADQSCAALVRNRPPIGPWRLGTSGPGASTGRNTGVKLATGAVLGFPDDNCFYPADTPSRVVELLDRRPGLAGVSGQLRTASGAPSLLRWLDGPTPVSRRNFLRTTICSTLFVRRRDFDTVGPFDESIGAGSPGWIGAGEESDLILRLLAAGHRISYEPAVVVNHEDDRLDPSESFVAKMLGYGAGTGHLWRQHRLPVSHLAYLSARKLTGIAVHRARGERIRSRADAAYLRGMLAGWRGSPP